jgi:hypothetical protein
MKFIRRPLISIIRLADIISVILTSILIYQYLYWLKPWPLSDAISICIMGSLLKLFKLHSMRAAVEFLTPYVLMNTMFCVYLIIKQDYEWADTTSDDLNSPFALQVPFFKLAYGNKCGWVSVINIVCPGTLL